MPYVHLANGDVETLDQEQMNEAFGDGSPIAYNKEGTQYAVIGVYPDGVKMEETEESEEHPEHHSETQTTAPQETTPPQSTPPTQSTYGKRERKSE